MASVILGTVVPLVPVVAAESELVSTDVVSFSVEGVFVKVALLLASGEKSVLQSILWIWCFVVRDC